jgi:hypothetical protein
MATTSSDSSLVKVVLVEKDGRYFIYEPGLAVVASGQDVQEAYANFVSSRRGYIAEIERAGLPVGAGAVGSSLRSFGSEIGLFAVKGCIVFLLVLGLATIALRPLATVSMYDVSDKAAVVAKDLRELAPASKETLRRSLAEIAREIGPLAEAWRTPGDVPRPENFGK